MPHLFSLLAAVLMADPQSDIVHNAVGTGPFKLAGFTSGVEVQLVRNEQYWKPDRPLLDAVTLHTFSDPLAALNFLEAGTFGMVPCAAGDVQRLKAGAQTSAVVFPGSGNYNFLVSTVDPPFTDKRVRQAIDLALNRKRFA